MTIKLTNSGILLTLFLLGLGGSTTFLYLNLDKISSKVTLGAASIDHDYQARFSRMRAFKGGDQGTVYEFFSEDHKARISIFNTQNQGDQSKLFGDPYGSLLRFRSGSNQHASYQTQTLKFANANIDPRKAQGLSFTPLNKLLPSSEILFDSSSSANSQIASFKIKDEYYAIFFVTTNPNVPPCNRQERKWPYLSNQLQAWIISARSEIDLKTLLAFAVSC